MEKILDIINRINKNLMDIGTIAVMPEDQKFGYDTQFIFLMAVLILSSSQNH